MEVSGLEPPTSTLRIQIGLRSDLSIYEKAQLDRHFGRPLVTFVDPYSPPNRARIAHKTAMATLLESRHGPSSARKALPGSDDVVDLRLRAFAP